MATLFNENQFEAQIEAKIQSELAKQAKNTSYFADVVRQDSEGTWWVRFVGNDTETPVVVNRADMSVGDLVSVTIDNDAHLTVVDSNVSNPPWSGNRIQYVFQENAEATAPAVDFVQSLADYGITSDSITRQHGYFEELEAHNITAQSISAATGYIKSLNADEIYAETITANVGKIKDISGETLNYVVGYIGDLTSENITVENLTATVGYIADLTAENITTQSIDAAVGFIGNLTANNITAQDIRSDHATITTLDSTYATIQNLNAATGRITNLESTKADITFLRSNYIDANTIAANYAQANLANVNNAWIQNGVIKDAAIGDAQILGVSANKLTAGTIDANKINVANLRAKNLIVEKLNGQPVLGGYELVNSNMSGYSSKNPSTEGWYEYSNGSWVASTDTAVNTSKVYYKDAEQVSLYDQTYIDGLESNLNQRIDGAVETFTGTAVPTMVTYPVSDWSSSEYASHVGDIYYVTNPAANENGYCYRFAYDNTSQSYNWVLIKDSDVTKALSDISDLQTFESETTSWIEETDEGIRTIRQNHTSLSGVVDKTVKSSVQLWYTKADTTAPGKPTSKVTSTSTAGNAWRAVVPAYNASYPNYYYCWQYELADGTFVWSDVVRDIAMGETQGTSRDAQTKANAALPASTFSTFQTTTFKELVDEVGEQSSTITTMRERVDTIANPNLSPYFSYPYADTSYWKTTSNPKRSSELGDVNTQLEDGWGHIDMDNSARTGNSWLNIWNVVNPRLKPSTTYTFLAEVRNWNARNTAGACGLAVCTGNETSTRNDQFVTGTPSQQFTGNGEYRFTATTRTSFADCTGESDGFIYVNAGGSYAFDLRISLYEGEYSGPYKPCVADIGDVTTISQTVNSVKQTADTNSASIRQVTERVENLTASATNLVRNGNFSNAESGTKNWSIAGSSSSITASVETDSARGKVLKVIQSVAGSPAGTECRIYPAPINNTENFTHENAKTYSISFYAKAAAANTIFVGVGGTTQQILRESISTSWTRYTKTYTTTATGSLTFFLVSAGTLYLSDVMLVHGDFPMDWAPDPRDVNNQIVTITTKTSEITQTLDGVKTVIGYSENTSGQGTSTLVTKVNNIDETVDGHTQSIQSVTTTLQEGGRNLVDDERMWTKGENASYTTQGLTTTRLGPSLFRTTGTTTGTGDHWVMNRPTGGFASDPGKYTYSVSIEDGTWPVNALGLRWAVYTTSNNTWLKNITGETGKKSVTFEIESGQNAAHGGFYVAASGATVDVTYRLQLEHGEIATSWSSAPEDFATLSQDYANYKQTVNEFEATVGRTLAESVRNVLFGTVNPTVVTGKYWSLANQNANLGWYSYNTNGGTVSKTTDGVKFTHISTSASTGLVIPFVEKNPVKAGEKLTLSFEYRGTLTTLGRPYILNASGANSPQNNLSNVTLTGDGAWHTYTESWTAQRTTADAVAFLLSYTSNASAWLEVRDGTVILEHGDVAKRLSTAETSISSNATQINLRATKSEVYESTQPNLAPMFSSHNTDETYPDGGTGGYWQPSNDKTYNRSFFSALEDGWMHVQAATSIQKEFVPARVDGLKENDRVTMLVEWRNASWTGNGANFYSRNYPNNVQLPANWSAPTNTASGEARHTYTVSAANGQQTWNGLINWTFTAKDSSSTWTGDIRISFYKEAQDSSTNAYIQYAGPYKPYSGDKLYASQAELKIQSDRIGMVVSNADASSTLALTANAMTYIGNHVEIKDANGTNTVISGGKLKTNLISVSSLSGASNYATNTSVDNKISGIEIGGRNWMLKTADVWQSRTLSNGSNETITLTSGVPLDFTAIPGIAVNDIYTISFDIMFASNSTVSSGYIQGDVNNGGSPWTGHTLADGCTNLSAQIKDCVSSTKSTRLSTSIKITANMLNGTCTGKWAPSLRFDNSSGAVYVKAVKVEKGLKATDWTPAPEDQRSMLYLDTTYTTQTLATVKGWAEEGKTSNWDVTPSGTSGVKVGDFVFLRTQPVDNNGADVYVTATVTAINSATQIRATPHGYIDTAGTVRQEIITTASDFDNYKTTGIYYFKVGSNTNAPKTNHGKLTVNFDLGTPYQIFEPDNLNYYYKRTYTTSSSTWSAWTELDAKGAKDLATTANNKALAWRGTSSTAAATPAKEVSCTGFTLVGGAYITVRFTYGNTSAGALTLNVNSTGAKNVYVSRSATSDTNRLLWADGAVIDFYYDGTQWLAMNTVKSWYGSTCSTAEGTAAKTTNCPEVIVCRGTTISVPFTNSNTSSSMTLNVNGTGACTVYHGSSTNVPTKVSGSTGNGLAWPAGEAVIFTYDGKFWRTGNQTFIDGGHITTGTISADRIAVSDIAIGDLNGYPALSTRVGKGESALTKVDYATRHCQVGQSTGTVSNTWYKFASTRITGANTDYTIQFAVQAAGNYSDTKRDGTLRAHFRTGGTVGTYSNAQLQWVNRASGIVLSHFVLAYKATSGTAVDVELWCKVETGWHGYQFFVEYEATRTDISTSKLWDIYDNWGQDKSTASITSGYTQVASTDTDAARGVAETYITNIDSNRGITVKPSDSSGNDYLQMNSTDIRFVRNNVDVMNLTDSAFRMGPATSGHSTVKSDGLHIWTGAESTATNEVAFFGSTARLGRTGAAHIDISSTSITMTPYLGTAFGTFQLSSSELYIKSTICGDIVKINNAFTLGARGNGTVGNGSVAIGDPTNNIGVAPVASGANSYARGHGKATGNYSTAVGSDQVFTSTATGIASVAYGDNVEASSDYQVVFGKSNVADTAGTYAVIIGDGDGLSVHNLFDVAWSGVATIQKTSSTTEGTPGYQTDTGFRAICGNVSMFTGIGSGGTNHGLYSHKLGKWLIYADASDMYLNGTKVPASPKFTDTTALTSMSGTLAIGHGGTGQTGTSSGTSGLIGAGSGVTIQTQEYAKWGKVCQIHIKYTYNAAISSGNITNITVGTLNDGYKPKIMSAGWSHGDEGGRAWHTITTGGVVSLGATDQSITAGASIHCFATFILP